MSYWAGLKASIKTLKGMLVVESDPRRAARIEAEIAAKQTLLASRS
jgi:hypothetical protein